MLPVYNGALFLEEAIKSVLAQTLQDFEIVVVDDGSTDQTPEVLSQYADPRVRVLRNERNVGLVESLNRGVAEAQSDLIARLDADDLMLPHRLARQVEYMRAEPECGLLGTGFRWQRLEDDVAVEYRPLTRHAALRFQLLFANAVTNVVFRRAIWQDVGGYRDPGGPAEDYDFYLRTSSVTRVANIPDILSTVRHHPASISARNSRSQLDTTVRISAQALSSFHGHTVSPVQVLRMATYTYPTCHDVAEAERLILRARLGVRQECKQRGIDASGATQVAALMLHSMRYRTVGGTRCYRRLLSLPFRSPTVASSLAARLFGRLWAKLRP